MVSICDIFQYFFICLHFSILLIGFIWQNDFKNILNFYFTLLKYCFLLKETYFMVSTY